MDSPIHADCSALCVCVCVFACMCVCADESEKETCIRKGILISVCAQVTQPLPSSLPHTSFSALDDCTNQQHTQSSVLLAIATVKLKII